MVLVLIFFIFYFLFFFTLMINAYALVSFTIPSANNKIVFKIMLSFITASVITIMMFSGELETVDIPMPLLGGITGISIGCLFLRSTPSNSIKPLGNIFAILILLFTCAGAGIIISLGLEYLFTFLFNKEFSF